MIDNFNLELFLSIYFGKNIKEITKEDLNCLKILSLDGKNIDDKKSNLDFKKTLSLFPNLEKLSISNYKFSNKDIDEISKKNILEYNFYKCDFTNISNLNEINHVINLSLERCSFKDYNFLNYEFSNLKVLSICNPSDEEEINLLQLNSININKLYLERCIVTNFKNIITYKSLEFVNILNTSITNDELLCFANCNNLKKLYVSNKYVNNDTLKILKSKCIDVKFDVRELTYEREEA